MKVCQPHWAKLRDAIAARGLSHLIARDGRQAHENVVLELEGREREAHFDPLMAAHNLLWERAVESLGLYVMRPAEGDAEPCPVCDLIAHTPPMPAGQRYATNEVWYIEGPADAVLAECQARNLAPREDGARGGDTPCALCNGLRVLTSVRYGSMNCPRCVAPPSPTPFASAAPPKALPPEGAPDA